MIRIGTMIFDLYDGNIETPKWSGVSFFNPGSRYAGVHLIPPVPLPFTLRLTRFDHADRVDANLAMQIAQIGTTNPISTDRLWYDSAPYRVRFVVLDVAEVSRETHPYVAGFRSGNDFVFSPASRLVTDWTMVAVPLV